MSYSEHLRRVENRKALLKEAMSESLGDEKRIVLEVGCGHGHWLTDYAATHNDAFCLGIDVIGDRIDRANRKARRSGAANLQFLKAEAMEFLELLEPSLSIGAVFILFPDPWPKKRHWKNRIMNPAFMESLARFCPKGALLHFRTDHEGYFEWTVESLSAFKDWRRTSGADWPFERETVFQSKASSYQSLILERR